MLGSGSAQGIRVGGSEPGAHPSVSRAGAPSPKEACQAGGGLHLHRTHVPRTRTPRKRSLASEGWVGGEARPTPAPGQARDPRPRLDRAYRLAGGGAGCCWGWCWRRCRSCCWSCCGLNMLLGREGGGAGAGGARGQPGEGAMLTGAGAPHPSRSRDAEWVGVGGEGRPHPAAEARRAGGAQIPLRPLPPAASPARSRAPGEARRGRAHRACALLPPSLPASPAPLSLRAALRPPDRTAPPFQHIRRPARKKSAPWVSPGSAPG